MKKLLLLSLSAFFTFSAFSQSLLWEITGKGIKHPSYLYGTIHIQDKRVFSYDKIVEDKINECKAYAMEILMDDVKPEVAQAAVIMENQSLDKLLSKEDYTLLDSVFKAKTGTGIALYKKMKPFFIMSQLMQSDMNQDMELALDLHFLDIAKKNGKKTLGIEDFEDQIGAVDKLPLEAQCEMLMESIKNPSDESDKFDEMLAAYLNAELTTLMILINDTTMPAVFNDEFIVKRNIKMANNIAKFAKKQSSFCAIGAAHLPGSDGVIELLRSKGLEVKPVLFKFQNN